MPARTARDFMPLSVDPSDGSAGSALFVDAGQTEYRSTTCLVGDWKVHFFDEEKTATVRAGEETVVDFAKR
jgi:hypothetical protein